MIIAKAISNINASTTTDIDGNNILQFSYDLKDNYDTDTTGFDSFYSYVYNIPVKDLSLKLITNQDDEYTEYFEIRYGNNQISFANNEYYLVDNSQPLNPGLLNTLITQLIYA